jgi:nucleoside-diphosphate-sugar epimerase
MKILLVGGTGMLGTGFMREAINQHIEVYVLSRGQKTSFIPQGVHLLKADIKDFDKVANLIADLYFDAIIDCLCWNVRDLEYHLNLFKSKVSQYVFVSSCAVYNVLVNNYMCDENSPKVVRNYGYSINKNLCEDYLRKEALLNGINYTIVRPATTYPNYGIPYGNGLGTYQIINRILHGKPIVTYNKGENRINMTHTNDVAAGVIGLLGNKLAYNEAFNVVGDEIPSRQDILNILSELLRRDVKTIDVPVEYYDKEIPHRKGDVLLWESVSSSFSNEKIKTVVKNFRQNITLRDGMEIVVEIFKKDINTHQLGYGYEGNYDRMISKYLRKNSISASIFNLYFIDYQNKKNKYDKYKYYIAMTNKTFMRFYTVLAKFFKKWKRKRY